MAKKLRCWALMFGLGGLLYNLIELLWRGYTHWSMFFVGGACFQIIGRIHTLCRRSLWQRCALCAAAITMVEFISGCVVNLRWKLNVWDYSHMLLNIKGQVCLLYSLLWGVLSWIAVPVYRCCRCHVEGRPWSRRVRWAQIAQRAGRTSR